MSFYVQIGWVVQGGEHVLAVSGFRRVGLSMDQHIWLESRFRISIRFAVMCLTVLREFRLCSACGKYCFGSGEDAFVSSGR